MMHDIWSMNIYDIGYMIHEKYMIHDICHIIFDECYMIHDIWYMIYNKWCMIYDILFVIIYMIYDLWFQIHDMIYVICDFGSMELVLDCTQDDIFDFPRETCICFAETYPFCCFFCGLGHRSNGYTHQIAIVLGNTIWLSIKTSGACILCWKRVETEQQISKWNGLWCRPILVWLFCRMCPITSKLVFLKYGIPEISRNSCKDNCSFFFQKHGLYAYCHLSPLKCLVKLLDVVCDVLSCTRCLCLFSCSNMAWINGSTLGPSFKSPGISSGFLTD